jgi:hypothetical protein
MLSKIMAGAFFLSNTHIKQAVSSKALHHHKGQADDVSEDYPVATSGTSNGYTQLTRESLLNWCKTGLVQLGQHHKADTTPPHWA